MLDWRRLARHPLLRLLALGVLAMPLFMMLMNPQPKMDPLDYLLASTGQTISEPESYMTQLKLTRFNDEGRIQYEFQARRAARQADTDVTIATDPQITFRESPKPWFLESNFGKLSADRSRVDLWDSVSARHLNDELRIDTTALTLYPDRHYAETDRAVRMSGKNSTTEATGLRADLNEERFILLSDVRSTHDPKPH